MSGHTTVGTPAWSYSRLKNFETCPKRHYHYDIAKDVHEPESEQLRAGNDLHKHFEDRLKRRAPLPLGYTQYEPLLAKIVDAPGVLSTEGKLAITGDFQPSAYFGKQVWFRTVVDAIKVNEEIASIFDWKNGKPKEDITQLQLMAATVFVHQPQVERIKAGLIFVTHDHVETAEFVRGDQAEIWSEILPRVRVMQRAVQKQDFPPKPSGLCRNYCGVKSCPFWRKGG
jgi:hypothetical protein